MGAVDARSAEVAEPQSHPGSLQVSLGGRGQVRERSLALLPRALVIAPLLAVAAAYGAAHYWLCDDAFISFRYARNFIEGHGLVFNVGERVEGYTNFLWVLELSALWKLLGVRPEHSSVALSALLSAGTLFLTAQLARRTPFAGRSFAAVAAALLLLAVNRNFAVWSTSGLETRQCTFLVLLALLLQQRAQRGEQDFRAASLAWGAAALTRPDAQLLFVCAVAWELVRAVQFRRFKVRALAALVGPAVCLIGAHLLFRFAYYGEWLPNTYYAKHVRPWPEAGLTYLTEMVIENGLYVVGPVALLGAYARFSLRRDDLLMFALPTFGLHAAYWAWIGGDHFEFRPADVYWPLLAVAAADGWLAVCTAVGLWLRRWDMPRREEVARFFGGLVLALIVLYSTVLQVVHASLTHDLRTRQETFSLRAEITLDSAPIAFALPLLEHLLPAYNAGLRFTSQHGIAVRWQEHRTYWKHRKRQYARYEPYGAELFTPQMVMETGTIGVAPYHLSGLTVIDAHGLTDHTVARTPVTRRNRDRQLAHDRSAPPGYMRERGVNLEVHPAARSLAEALGLAPYAVRLEEGLWMPLSSPDPRWLEQAFAERSLWHRTLGPTPKDNVWIVDGRRAQGKRELGFFERGLGDWTATGDAMQAQPRPGAVTGRQLALSGAHGRALINSFHPRLGDAAEGELWSSPFVPGHGDLLAFLVGGGSGADVGVELRVAGEAVRVWRGLDSEALGPVVHELSAYAGEPCQIRIYDQSKDTWGHILADHFMLAH